MVTLTCFLASRRRFHREALDAPAQKALTAPTHEPIGKAILPKARILEKSNFRRPQWKERGLGSGHHGLVRRHPGRGNP